MLNLNKLKPLGIAFIRTSLVPPVGGFLIAKLLEWGIDVKPNSPTVFYLVTVILSGLYYLGFAGLEALAKNPKVRKLAGIFLGMPKPPRYEGVN